MKVLSSLKSAKERDKDCRVVRRKGRVYVINKKNPRMKAKQAQLASYFNFFAASNTSDGWPSGLTLCQI